MQEDCRACLVRNHILPAYLAFKLGRYMIYIFKLPTHFGLAFLSIWIHSKYFKKNTIYFWHTKTEIDCPKQSPKYRPAMTVANNKRHISTNRLLADTHLIDSGRSTINGLKQEKNIIMRGWWENVSSLFPLTVCNSYLIIAIYELTAWSPKEASIKSKGHWSHKLMAHIVED